MSHYIHPEETTDVTGNDIQQRESQTERQERQRDMKIQSEQFSDVTLPERTL